MAEPLTKHERFNIQTCPLTGREKELVDSYEATVAALEDEVARLRPLAEVGKAVGRLPLGWSLLHEDRPGHKGMWTVSNEHGRGVLTGISEVDVLTNAPALRAAKGEKTDYAH